MDDDLDVGGGSHILASVSRIRTARKAATMVVVPRPPKTLWGFTWTRHPAVGEPRFRIIDEVRFTALILIITACICAFGFLIADFGLGRVNLSKITDEAGHGVAVIVGGVFASLACILSYIQVKAHRAHWTHPPSQRLVVRILYMVPIYACSAWGSLTFLDLSSYIDFIRGVYEAFVIYTFMILLTKYLGGHSGVVEWMKYKTPQPWPSPLCFLKKVKPDSQYLYYLKYGALQYTILTPICSLAAVVLSTFDAYEDGVIAYDNGYPYVAFILNCSQLVSLYCLVWLYVCMKNELAPFGPLYKFLVVKAVVFATFWQGVGLALMAHFGWISGTGSFTVGEVQVGLQDFLVCCLARGTKVCRANGELADCETIMAGDVLLGQKGKAVRVKAVQHFDDRIYRVATAVGNLDVTINHLLTIQWCRNPTITISKVAAGMLVDPTHSVTHAISVQFVRFDGRRLEVGSRWYPAERPIDEDDIDVPAGDDEEVTEFTRMENQPEFATKQPAAPYQPANEAAASNFAPQRGTRAGMRAFALARLHELRDEFAADPTRPSLMLCQGDIFDMSVGGLMEAWEHKPFNLGTCGPRWMTAVRAPLPSLVVSHDVTAASPVSHMDAAGGLCDASEIHASCALLALGVDNGVGQYAPLKDELARGSLVARIGYQLHNPLLPAGSVDRRCNSKVAATFLNLDTVHEGLELVVTRDTGLITCEINPIDTETDMSNSIKSQYDAACDASIISALGLGLTSFVAFGDFTRSRWEGAAKELNDPSGRVHIASVQHNAPVTFQHANVTVQSMKIDYTLQGTPTSCNVFFAPHPSDIQHMSHVAAAIGLAHGLSLDAVSGKLSFFSSTGGYHPAFTAMPALLHDGNQSGVVNIVCEGERESDKRYVVVPDPKQGALLTHNCEMFVAACMHKYTFGSETYADGSLRLIMEQRALYLAEQSYKRAQEAQREAQKLADELAEAADPSLKGTKQEEHEETPEEAKERRKAMAAMIKKAMDEDTEGDVLFDEDEVDWTTGNLPVAGHARSPVQGHAFDYVYAYELEHQRAEGVDDPNAVPVHSSVLTIPMGDVDFGFVETEFEPPPAAHPHESDDVDEERPASPSQRIVDEEEVVDIVVPPNQPPQSERQVQLQQQARKALQSAIQPKNPTILSTTNPTRMTQVQVRDRPREKIILPPPQQKVKRVANQPHSTATARLLPNNNRTPAASSSSSSSTAPAPKKPLARVPVPAAAPLLTPPDPENVNPFDDNFP